MSRHNPDTPTPKPSIAHTCGTLHRAGVYTVGCPACDDGTRD